MKIDILIVGGGTGGCAAAMSASEAGFTVALTEETDWIGGQLTSQAVPPDEHPWIERFGCTRRYRRFRDGIRNYYRQHYPLNAHARTNEFLNPGNAAVSRISHEPRVALAVLEQMLSYRRSSGKLHLLLRHKPIAVETEGDRMKAVQFQDLESGHHKTIEARYILDATELGDLLALGGVEYVSGAESRSQTGEQHAPEGAAQPENVQAFTWCFALAHDPSCPANSDQYLIEKPSQYARWRDYVPKLNKPWPGKLLSWTVSHPITLQPEERVLFPTEENATRRAIWTYRQVLAKEHYAPIDIHNISLVNWPQNDYFEGNIIDKDEATVARYLKESRELSLSLVYWLQTEAPRPDGGTGYRGLYLRPDVVGTTDGLAKAPYIRESRRIRSLFTVTEQHIGFDMRQSHFGESFKDSIGVGSYRIDLHPSTGGDNFIDIAAQLFQIPLGALIPQRMTNLLPACKNIGTTHITNGCYRLHPIEWNIGEVAGLLAAFCLQHNKTPHQVHAETSLFQDFQQTIQLQGVETDWPLR